MNYRLILLLVCILNVLIVTQAFAQEPTGVEIFEASRCANCHTIGRGTFVGPDLNKVTERYSKQEIIDWMMNSQTIYQATGKMPMNEGFPPMPPMNVPQEHAEKIYEYIKDFKIPADRLEKGIIKGTVINKTLDKDIADFGVKLTSYMGDRPQQEFVTTTNANGEYKFEDLAWDRSYVISIAYENVEYATGKLVFNPEESIKEIELPVFGTTDDPSVIKMDSSHLIIEIMGDTASVAELYVFNNTSKSVFIGTGDDPDKDRETIIFDLPSNAENLQFHFGMSEESSIKRDGKLISKQSIQPGAARVIYSYQIPLKNNTELKKTVNYPTTSQLVLVTDNGYDTTIDGLELGEKVEMHNNSFIKWSGENLETGHSIDINIKKPAVSGDYTKWIVMLAALLMIAAGIGYSIYCKNNTEEESTGGADEDQEVSKEALIKEIAKLDDMYEENKIGEQEYRKLREEKKNLLLKLHEK